MAIASDSKDRLNVRVAERRNSGDLGAKHLPRSQGTARLQQGIKKRMSGQEVEAVGVTPAFEELGSELRD